jgi:hypothetical protein
MDEKCMLWMKQLILWMKQLILWMKTSLFRVMDQKVILWMKRPNLWGKKIPALDYSSLGVANPRFGSWSREVKERVCDLLIRPGCVAISLGSSNLVA